MIFEKNDRIVFAGDSITDMGSEQPVGEGPGDGIGHSYVRVVENLLCACYPELNLRVSNSGISGNTSRDLLARFDRDVINLHPAWISICIGINDVWRQFDRPAHIECHVYPEEYEANMEKMIRASVAAAKGVLILTPYYMEVSTDDAMRARMDEYGSICKKLAKKYQVTCVDVQAMFNRYFTVRQPSYIAWDRVHPNRIGATLIAREILTNADFDFYHPYGV